MQYSNEWRFMALAIEKPLRNFLDRTTHPKVLFCGHSLGGALALLAGQGESGYWRIALPHSENVDAICSFGAPKVGDCQLGQLLNRVHFRYTLKGDLAGQSGR